MNYLRPNRLPADSPCKHLLLPSCSCCGSPFAWGSSRAEEVMGLGSHGRQADQGIAALSASDSSPAGVALVWPDCPFAVTACSALHSIRLPEHPSYVQRQPPFSDPTHVPDKQSGEDHVKNPKACKLYVVKEMYMVCTRDVCVWRHSYAGASRTCSS